MFLYHCRQMFTQYRKWFFFTDFGFFSMFAAIAIIGFSQTLVSAGRGGREGVVGLVRAPGLSGRFSLSSMMHIPALAFSSC